MAITKLHFTTGTSGGLSSYGSYQLTIPATSAGSLLVLDVNPEFLHQSSDFTAPLLVTDSAGSTYTAASSPISVLGGTTVEELAQYYAFNVAAGITWVEVTLNGSFTGSGNGYLTLGVWEFAGAATTSPVDVTINGITPGSTAPSLSLTTTVNGDVLIFATTASSGTIASGYSLGMSGGPTDVYMVQATDGSATCSLSGAPSGQLLMCFTAFKAAAAAAAAATHLLGCCGCGG